MRLEAGGGWRLGSRCSGGFTIGTPRACPERGETVISQRARVTFVTGQRSLAYCRDDADPRAGGKTRDADFREFPMSRANGSCRGSSRTLGDRLASRTAFSS